MSVCLSVCVCLDICVCVCVGDCHCQGCLYVCVCLDVCVSICVGDCRCQGYLYAIGGNNGTASLDTCERYDPHLNKWTAVEPMKKRRAGAGVAELHGYLYVVGMSALASQH